MKRRAGGPGAWAALLLVLLICALPACRRTPGAEQIEKAYVYAEGYDWNAALPLLKEYLVHHPNDAGGHLLLARCFLEVTPPALAIADGELQTALEIVRNGGQLGAFEGRLTREEFIAFIHEKRAKLYMRNYQAALNRNAPAEALLQQLTRSLEEVRLGLEADPDSAVLEDMREALLETTTLLQAPNRNVDVPPKPRPERDTGNWATRRASTEKVT